LAKGNLLPAGRSHDDAGLTASSSPGGLVLFSPRLLKQKTA
jgi:hypothetical protein